MSELKLLTGARQIVVTITDRGFSVQEGDRYADELCWDEMLGQVAELTHPELKRNARYRMLTTAEWKRWREQLGKSTDEIAITE